MFWKYILTVHFSAVLRVTSADNVMCTAGDFSVLSDRRGTITSPNYPHSYNDNADCGWRFPSGKAWNVLSLRLQTFSVNSKTRDCREDYLAVGDHKICRQQKRGMCFVFASSANERSRCSQTQLSRVRYCSRKVVKKWPPTITFHSNKNNIGRGFSLNYTVIRCQGNISSRTNSGSAPPDKGEKKGIDKKVPYTTQLSATDNPFTDDHDGAVAALDWTPIVIIILSVAVVTKLTVLSIILIRKLLRRKRQKRAEQERSSVVCDNENLYATIQDTNIRQTTTSAEIRTVDYGEMVTNQLYISR